MYQHKLLPDVSYAPLGPLVLLLVGRNFCLTRGIITKEHHGAHGPPHFSTVLLNCATKGVGEGQGVVGSSQKYLPKVQNSQNYSKYCSLSGIYINVFSFLGDSCKVLFCYVTMTPSDFSFFKRALQALCSLGPHQV